MVQTSGYGSLPSIICTANGFLYAQLCLLVVVMDDCQESCTPTHGSCVSNMRVNTPRVLNTRVRVPIGQKLHCSGNTTRKGGSTWHANLTWSEWHRLVSFRTLHVRLACHVDPPFLLGIMWWHPSYIYVITVPIISSTMFWNQIQLLRVYAKWVWPRSNFLGWCCMMLRFWTTLTLEIWYQMLWSIKLSLYTSA